MDLIKYNIGVIGATGRMGKLLIEEINNSNDFRVQFGYSRSKIINEEIKNCLTIKEIFEKNDYIIDFSSPELIKEILENAVNYPKPLILCTTGWNKEQYENNLEFLSKKIPIVIAPNTSIGANIQLYITKKITHLLDEEFDIDITDKHHRNKIDIPSGTAKNLLNQIIKVKKIKNMDYSTWDLRHGPRPDNFIGMKIERSGNLAGEHQVSFTSNNEMISIKHTAFDRLIFAKGAIKIIKWLKENNVSPGKYSMLDVLNLK